MKLSTLVFCLKEGQVLLAMKKRGFGAGKWNGYGGKVLEEETPRKAAIRELEEESSLIVAEGALEQVALVRFYFEEKQLFECHVFLAEKWEGEPRESDEMNPCWFVILGLPFEKMWVADSKWIPLILSGKKLEVKVNFNASGDEIKNFSSREREFD